MMFFVHEIPKGINALFSQIISPKFIKKQRTEHSEEQLKKPTKYLQPIWFCAGLAQA